MSARRRHCRHRGGHSGMRSILPWLAAAGERPQAVPFVRGPRRGLEVKVFSRRRAGCEKARRGRGLGQDRLRPLSAAKIRDELRRETLARNKAPGVGADSISPITHPGDGEQRWRWRFHRLNWASTPVTVCSIRQRTGMKPLSCGFRGAASRLRECSPMLFQHVAIAS